MSAFLPLWRRELAAYFRTSVAYGAGAFFLAVAGFGFWSLAGQLAREAPAGDLAEALFGSVRLWPAILIVTPLLTMRLFAEERRMGTLEALLSAPVTETEVVLAKYAGAGAMFALLWAPTLAYVPLLRQCGGQLPPLDWGVVAAGYLGLALIGAFFLAVGLLCSLLTRHQIVAAMACLATLGLLVAAGLAPAAAGTGPWPAAARRMSAPLHMADFAAGVVDTRTVVGYLGATVLLLFTAIRILEARRLR